MAKAKKGKRKATAKRTRRAPARKPKKAGSAQAAAAKKRVAALEAENRRLREQLAELRAQVVQHPATSAPSEGQATLEL